MTTVPHFEPFVAERDSWTLPAVLELRARSHPDKVFLRAAPSLGGERLTFRDAYASAVRIGSGLVEAGGAPGDRVLILAQNSLDFVRAWFGASVAGLVEVPVNTAYSGSFLEHQVRTALPTFAVVDSEFASRFLGLPDVCRSIRRFYVMGEPGEVARTVDVLERAGLPARPFADLDGSSPAALPSIRSRDLSAVLFTSGTTGASKGVMMPHAQMHLFAEITASVTGLSESDVALTAAPLFHGNAQFVCLYPALLAAAEVVVERRFSASRWSTWLHDYGITVTNFVGVMMEYVWSRPPSASDAGHRLRCVNAAPTASSIEARFKERFGIASFVEAFGSTELCAPIAVPLGVARPPGSCGRAVDQWFEVALIDPESHEPVADGEVGELVVRPRFPWTTSVGYFGAPEASAEMFRNVWHHSGDALRRDSDGWFYFVDRLSDSLRRRGENISSQEIEAPIAEHPDVEECAVVAVPADFEAGEDEVMVFVVPVSGTTPDAGALWTWCESRLPAFAVPRYIRFVESLPRTQTEKVQKSLLRARGVDSETHDREGASQR